MKKSKELLISAAWEKAWSEMENKNTYPIDAFRCGFYSGIKFEKKYQRNKEGKFPLLKSRRIIGGKEKE